MGNASFADVNKFLDINTDTGNFLQNFEVCYSYTPAIQNENPFLGDFSERVLRDNDDDVDENMKISSVDTVNYFIKLKGPFFCYILLLIFFSYFIYFLLDFWLEIYEINFTK